MTSSYVHHTKVIESILNTFKEELPILKSDEEFRHNMAEKFHKYGNVITVEKEEEPIGFVAFYSNDISTQIAYISFIAVKQKYQGTGVGTLLLNICEEQSKKNGMNQIRLEVNTNNESAQLFYRKNGFDFETIASEKSYYMIKGIKQI